MDEKNTPRSQGRGQQGGVGGGMKSALVYDTENTCRICQDVLHRESLSEGWHAEI